MPKLLGRTAAELGLSEMFSIVHDTRPLGEVMELLGTKDFFCGQHPTFIDFCVYDSLLKAEGHSDKDKAYMERVKNLI